MLGKVMFEQALTLLSAAIVGVAVWEVSPDVRWMWRSMWERTCTIAWEMVCMPLLMYISQHIIPVVSVAKATPGGGEEATVKGKYIEIPFQLHSEKYSILVPYNRRASRATVYKAFKGSEVETLNHHPCIPLLIDAATLGVDRISATDGVSTGEE